MLREKHSLEILLLSFFVNQLGATSRTSAAMLVRVSRLEIPKNVVFDHTRM